MELKADRHSIEDRIEDLLSYRVTDPDSIGAMLDFAFEGCDADKKELTLSHVIHKRELNLYGMLHGGISAWLMDSGMGITARAYTGYKTLVTLDLNIQFLRAVYEGEKVMITSRVKHAGRKIVNLTSELYVGDKLCATASSVYFNSEK